MPEALLPAPAAGALARAGFARWATYRQAALAGMFTNTVFGIIKLSVLLAVIDETGGTVAGYDHASLSTYVWVSQGLIAVVYMFSSRGAVFGGALLIALTNALVLYLLLGRDSSREFFGLGARARP